MGKRDVLTKILASAGTILACFPLLAPILLSAFAALYWHMARFDFLMPAELFSFAMAGGCLLVWAAWRARLRLGLIGCELGVAIASLIGSQGAATVTGLASGATEPAGWRLALVLGLLAVYVLALVALGASGVLLLRDLSRPLRPPGSSAR